MSKRFNKKGAQTFSLVHRSYEDPLFHDPDAPDRVLVPASNSNQDRRNHKIKTTSDLESELQEELSKGKIRQNEGEAALYGVTYDDSKYDYMKHLKPMGEGEGIFVPKSKVEEGKARNKEILFKEELLPSDILPSKKQVVPNYQDFQNFPDAISGFKPDLDPRIREVLEALEDEAYVEEDDDIFQDLIASGKAEEDEPVEEFDEWDMDNYDDYEKETYGVDENGVSQEWQSDFKKFLKDNKKAVNEWDSDDDFGSEEDDIVPDLPSLDTLPNKKVKKGKLRKKKGAMTDTSSFSMSSSALFRTEGLTILDDKHEVLMKKYEEEQEDEEYKPFDLKNERADLNDLMDDFLNNYELQNGGRKLAKKDAEIDRLKAASDSVSKSKVAAKRNKAKKQNPPNSLSNLAEDFKNVKI